MKIHTKVNILITLALLLIPIWFWNVQASEIMYYFAWSENNSPLEFSEKEKVQLYGRYGVDWEKLTDKFAVRNEIYQYSGFHHRLNTNFEKIIFWTNDYYVAIFCSEDIITQQRDSLVSDSELSDSKRYYSQKEILGSNFYFHCAEQASSKFEDTYLMYYDSGDFIYYFTVYGTHGEQFENPRTLLFLATVLNKEAYL